MFVVWLILLLKRQKCKSTSCMIDTAKKTNGALTFGVYIPNRNYREKKTEIGQDDKLCIGRK